jgi:hypothetical protein
MYRGSASDFVDWVFNEFIGKYELTTHYVLNEWYRVDGDGAEGETHRISHHRIRTPEAKETIAACRTFNRYECRSGIWKISCRGVVRDWIYERPFDESLYVGTYAMALSKHGRADRSYDVLSLFRRGPIDRDNPAMSLTQTSV